MKRVILFLVALILVQGCVPVRVVDVGKLSPTASGRAYKTYNFGEVNYKTEPFAANQKNLLLVTAAIDREMQAKGFKRSAVDPDLVINLGVAITEEVQTRETNIMQDRNRWQYGEGRSYSWQSEEIEVARYKEGHLALDFVDREKKEMIWQGSVAGTMDKSQKKMEERINKAIKSLFAKSPLKAN